MVARSGHQALLLLAMALAALVLGGFGASVGCPEGQVYNLAFGDCDICPPGTAKYPDLSGDTTATCERARLICGTAEVAINGRCTPCPATQVGVDDRTCLSCPKRFAKVPMGVVSNAACKPTGCLPHAEVCNGKDDDCDGLVDEGLGSVSCGVGVCKRTVAACLNGTPQACKPGLPKAEVCNGLDDDCDGQVDENLGSTTCGVGACRHTVPNCLSGKPQACKPLAPSREVCDGIDNDCDGQVDEGIAPLVCQPCGKQVPACAGGKPGSCAGVCGAAPNPNDPMFKCCQNCELLVNYPIAMANCFANCDDDVSNCVELPACLDFAKDVAAKVAKVACHNAMRECSIVDHFQAYPGPHVPRELCYKAARVTCIADGKDYALNVSPTAFSDYCSHWSTAETDEGSICSNAEFQAKVVGQLDSLCTKIAEGIAMDLDT